MTTAMIISLAIFSITFLFILTERIHRAVIAFIGAALMVMAGTLFDFYHAEHLIEAVDFNTLGLLFGMMILVVILEKTGFFQYMSILTAKKTGGSPWLLLVSLSTLTAVLSMVLDNVTTIILIIPITITIAKMLALNPVPILLAEALLSNVGGTATLVGDPPNIIIGSAANFSFNAFLIHSLPVVIVAWLLTLVYFRVMFKKELSQKSEHVDKLQHMDEKEALTDVKTLKRALGVLGLVVILFFLHGALHLEPSLIAIFGASLLLLLSQATQDPQPVLEKVELSVLLFFGSLFVLVGGLEAAGILEIVAQMLLSGAAENLLLTAIIILWLSAILSGIVDNIPLTVAMVPIIGILGSSGVPVDLIWWALVFGVGFGGNASPIGSTAGVITMTKSEQTDTPISFMRWMKTGLPVTVIALSIATVALVVMHEFEVVEVDPSVPIVEAAEVEAMDTPTETTNQH